METVTVTAAALRDQLAMTRERRQQLDADCSALALRRVQGDVDAIAAADRMRGELARLDDEIRTLEDAIRIADAHEAAERAARFEAETAALEQTAAAQEQRLAEVRSRLTRTLKDAVDADVRALLRETAAYTSLQHRIYERRGYDRTDLARLHASHRMLGPEAASMLSDTYLRQAIAMTRHAARTEEQHD